MDTYVRVIDFLDYSFCPRKIYLKRVLGLEEERGEKALFGTLVHSVFDRLNEIEEEIVYKIDDEYPFDYILKLYEATANKIINDVLDKYSEEIKEFSLSKEYLFIELKKHIYDDIYERAKNVYNTMKIYQEYGIFLWDKLEPKIKSELELLSDTLKIVGRIDRVEFYKDYIVPVEIKSGNSSSSHIFQIHAYALLLRHNFPNYTIDRGVIYYTKSRQRREVKLSYKYFSKVLAMRDKILSIIENEQDPGMNKNLNKCKKCTFYEVCKKLKHKKVIENNGG